MNNADRLYCVETGHGQQYTEVYPLRATSHLYVKRERPLIITYSLYPENIMHYHFHLKHVREEE